MVKELERVRKKDTARCNRDDENGKGIKERNSGKGRWRKLKEGRAEMRLGR